MQSGRFLLAIVLMIAVIVATNLLFPPPPAPREEPGAPERAAAEVVEPEARRAPPPPEAAAPAGVPAAEFRADTAVVVSPLYRYALSSRGGALVGAELLRYESFTREGPVELVPENIPAILSYRLRLDGRVIDLRQLPFTVEPAGVVTLGAGGEPRTVRFAYDDPQGEFAVRLEYAFQPENYLIDVRGEVRGRGEASPLLLLDLGPTLAVNEADPEEDYRALGYVVNSTREGIQSLRLDDVQEERVEEGPLLWAAIKNKYFLLAAISSGEERFGGLIARDVPIEHAAEVTTTLPIGADRSFAFRVYVGPQEAERLAAVGNGLEDVNPYGWKVFRPIIRPLGHVVGWALVAMHRALDLGYGWVLIIFGVLIRLLLWPLNARAMRAQIRNMALQPRMQEIQQKYKGDPEKLQREMIRLYREEGFNPLGGCLPMLIPFPVLITLFFVFQNTIEFRGVEFLWLPDLSRPDPYYVLPVVLGGSMFLMQWISARVTPPNPQMKMLTYFMPIFMVVIFLNLASGLNLYYAAQNLASIPQQIQLARERQRQQRAR